MSGGAPLSGRPSLQEAVEGVESGAFQGIMVAYLSRLGRNVREQLAVWDRVEAAGARIVVVRENIDTSTPNGRYVRTILLANAERELDEHTERFENLRRWATGAGIWQRRQPHGATGKIPSPASSPQTPTLTSCAGSFSDVKPGRRSPSSRVNSA